MRSKTSLSLIIGGLAIAAVVAATSASEAGFRGGGGFRMMGSRAPMMSRTPMVSRPQGVRTFKATSHSTAGRWNKGKTATSDARNPGREGTEKPPRGKHPPHRPYPPGIGPIGPAIGTGVGTGVLIGTLGPAGAGSPPITQNLSGPPGGRGGINIPPANERRFVEDEVLLEFATDLPPQGIAQLLTRNGLRQLEAQRFTLTNSTLIRARIIGARSVRATLARLGNEAILRTGQPNYYYEASQSGGLDSGETKITPTPAVATAATQPRRGDPAQYALGKLNLHEAHALATGDRILIAVIDSGIDLGHPELQGLVAGSYDALDKPEAAHKHGTGIAGAIVARARLLGAAPAARILAIRAFGAYGSSAEATSFAVVKGVEYAATHGARIINMSFNGPADPAMARNLAGARSLGIVLVAASGNLGPQAAPQYPAADPNVIAVSATDAKDTIFKASNIGSHIAVAAPGVDILVPAPNRDYQVTSGTSFAAAYVSGVAALLLQRAPGLRPETVRQIMEQTAKDLGPRGRDNEYGAGLVDAYQAIMAVESNAAAGAQDVPKLSAQ
jgi:subtilisin family serine protease